MPTFIGIDGGGTRATAVVTDDAGTECARIEGDAGLVTVTEPAADAAALATLALRALAAGEATPPARALCCALAGAGREPERRALTTALEAAHVAERVIVIGDGEAALHDAFGGGAGIVLVCGTGSSAWGRARDGRTARAGGWGALLGDEGSGYWLGLAALRACARAHDGRGSATALLPAVLAHAGLADAPRLIAWAAAAPKATIAALAPSVIETARAGDDVAIGIVEQAAADLAAHAAALYQRMGPWVGSVPVALAGGPIAPGRPLREPVLAALRALPHPLTILESEVDAARGAAALARHQAGPARS